MTVDLAILPKQFQQVNTSVVNTNGKGIYAPLKTISPTYYVRTVTSDVTETGNKKGNSKNV